MLFFSFGVQKQSGSHFFFVHCSMLPNARFARGTIEKESFFFYETWV